MSPGMARTVSSNRSVAKQVLPPELQNDHFACPALTQVEPPKKISEPTVEQISGVLSGRASGDYTWVHNESNLSPQFYALNRQGELEHSVILPAEIKPTEIADMGWQKQGDESYLLFADSGDRQQIRKNISLYRVKEPSLNSSQLKIHQITAEEFSKITLTFPEEPQDVQAFFSDPRSEQLIFLSKHLAEAPTIYVVDNPFKNAILSWAGKMSLKADGAPLQSVTAADISEDGSWIILRTYLSVFIFHRPALASVADSLRATPCSYQVRAEAQGESVAFSYEEQWSKDGPPRKATGFITISKGNPTQLNSYELEMSQ